MYAKEDGSFSGEALVVYFKEDSVLLALSLLDDAELRLGDPSTTMRVQKAEFTHKHTTNDSEAKPRKTIDKKKATKRIGKMQKSGENLFFSFPIFLIIKISGNCWNGMTKTGSVL